MLTEIIGYFMADSDKKQAERDAADASADAQRDSEVDALNRQFARDQRIAAIKAKLTKAAPYIAVAMVVLVLFWITRKRS